MRRQIGAVACATAALLAFSGAAAAAAHADDAAPPAATEAVQGASADREVALIRGQFEAGDVFGFEPSLYVGKWFMPGKEDVRRCIIDRESHSNYRASNGVYFGAYQMSKDLAVGAAWMMQDDIRREFGKQSEAYRIVQDLRKTTPDKWNRYWQDRAFWTIWSAPEGRGPGHWGGARCS